MPEAQAPTQNTSTAVPPPAAAPPPVAAPAQSPAGGAVTQNGTVAAPQVQQAAPLPTPAPVERVPTRKLINDADEEIPTDAELLEMSPRALKGRLDRHTKAQLRERFGVDSFDNVKAQLDELTELKRLREEQRLAELSETDRYKEMYAREQSARQAAEQQLTQYQESRMIEDQDRRVIAIAAAHVKPKHFNYVTQELARHLNTLSEDDLKDPETYIDGWFKTWTGENPEFGIGFGAQQAAPPPVAPAAAPPRQVPLTNTTNVARPTNASQPGSNLQKTAAPGRANSMTDAEWRDYKRQMGLNY